MVVTKTAEHTSWILSSYQFVGHICVCCMGKMCLIINDRICLYVIVTSELKNHLVHFDI